MGAIDWAKLFHQNRCKDIGVPWSDKELHAIYKLGIPAEYVRDGIMTYEDYEAVLANEAIEGKPLSRYNISELQAKAVALGLEFTDQVSREALMKMIQTAEEVSEPVDNTDDLLDEMNTEEDSEKEEAEVVTDPAPVETETVETEVTAPTEEVIAGGKPAPKGEASRRRNRNK